MKESYQQVVPHAITKTTAQIKTTSAPRNPCYPHPSPTAQLRPLPECPGQMASFPAVLTDHLIQITLGLPHSTFWEKFVNRGAWADLGSSPVSAT